MHLVTPLKQCAVPRQKKCDCSNLLRTVQLRQQWRLKGGGSSRAYSPTSRLTQAVSLTSHTLPHPSPQTQQIRPEEQRGIPHHLIDVLDPEAEFSAGDFFTLARAAAEDILQVSCIGWVRLHGCCWVLLLGAAAGC